MFILRHYRQKLHCLKPRAICRRCWFAIVSAVAWKPVTLFIITFHKLGEVWKQSKHIFPAKFWFQNIPWQKITNWVEPPEHMSCEKTEVSILRVADDMFQPVNINGLPANRVMILDGKSFVIIFYTQPIKPTTFFQLSFHFHFFIIRRVVRDVESGWRNWQSEIQGEVYVLHGFSYFT